MTTTTATHPGSPATAIRGGRWIRDPRHPGAVEVADAVQRRGVGGHLLRAALASARAAGASEVLAHVHPENGPVVAWLLRLGRG